MDPFVKDIKRQGEARLTELEEQLKSKLDADTSELRARIDELKAELAKEKALKEKQKDSLKIVANLRDVKFPQANADLEAISLKVLEELKSKIETKGFWKDILKDIEIAEYDTVEISKDLAKKLKDLLKDIDIKETDIQGLRLVSENSEYDFTLDTLHQHFVEEANKLYMAEVQDDA